MKNRLAVGAILLLLVGLVVGSHAEAQNDQTVIRISGSDSMFQRVKLMGKLFAKNNPSVTINVSQGGTMDSGIRAVVNGEADLAMAACSIRGPEDKLATEKGVKLVERVIGYGGVVIIANSSCNIESLTTDEVKKILAGDFTNWKQVGGIDAPIKVVRTDETHPGTLAFLERDFLNASFVKNATVVSTFPSIAATVADNPGAMGYVRIRELTESQVVRTNPKVKVISLSRSKSGVPIVPSRETVEDHSYPLQRPYFIYYNAIANKTVVDFADFLVKKGWGPQDL
jgi:phosphate transport system substrate-binding protein